MPSTIIYKSGFPSTATPVETSASIAADGLVTGSAVFIVPSTGTTAYPVNSRISPSLFSSLTGINLQGLFVESRSVENQAGLSLLRLGVVGAINPPVFQESINISPRSLNKSLTINDNTVTFSFDYLAETISVSTALVVGSRVNIRVRNPNIISRWNARGSGFIALWNPATGESAPPDSSGSSIVVYARVLTSESREQRGGIVRVVKSSQFVYE
jgi:hypothetical protein